MLFKRHQQNKVQLAANSMSALAKSVRLYWGEQESSRLYAGISTLSFDDELDLPLWTEVPKFAFLQPRGSQFWDTIITIAPAILDYLKDNQARDALIREIKNDLTDKFAYAASLANALTQIGEGLEQLESAPPAKIAAAVFGYLESFCEFESSFAEHKSMATWNRLKSALASRMSSSDFAKLSQFYMNFSIFAAICTRNTAKAEALLKELRIVLAGKPDKKGAQRVVQLFGQAVQCLGTVAKGVAEFFESLR